MLLQNNSKIFTFIYYPVFALLESENLASVITNMQLLNQLLEIRARTQKREEDYYLLISATSE